MQQFLPSPAPQGRPCKLNKELIARFVAAIDSVLFLQSALDIIGISRHTFNGWVRRGKKEANRLLNSENIANPKEALFVEIYHAHKKATASVETRAVQQIQAAANEHWQAAAWLLERRFPEKWGRDRAEIKALHQRIAELEKTLRGDANDG